MQKLPQATAAVYNTLSTFILTHKDWFLDLLLGINSNEPDDTCDYIKVSPELRHDVLEMGEQPGLENWDALAHTVNTLESIEGFF